jgi:hypothetical protein
MNMGPLRPPPAARREVVGPQEVEVPRQPPAGRGVGPRAVAALREPAVRLQAGAPREPLVPRQAVVHRQVAASRELPAAVQPAEHREPVGRRQLVELRERAERRQLVEHPQWAARRRSAGGPEAVGRVGWVPPRVRSEAGAAWSQLAAVSQSAEQSQLADCPQSAGHAARAQSHLVVLPSRAELREPAHWAARRLRPRPARPRQGAAAAPAASPGSRPGATLVWRCSGSPWSRFGCEEGVE